MIGLTPDTFSKLEAYMILRGYSFDEARSAETVALFTKGEDSVIYIQFAIDTHNILMQEFGNGMSAAMTRRMSGLIENHNIDSLFYWMNI